MKKTWIKNIGLLQTPVGSEPHKGEAQGQNKKWKNKEILIEDGRIVQIEDPGVIKEPHAQVIDAEGKLVTPGLVDGHTHLVFGGYRQHEVPLKLQGATYTEILKSGGGILNTLVNTRKDSLEELYEKSQGFLDEMLALGVTTCEVKSGYGLDEENEIKTLRVIRALDENHPMDLVPTFMGAHAVPPEYKGKSDEYISLLCDVVLPRVKSEGLARFADVFCEDGAFSLEQSKRYMEKAQELGFGLKIHADEIEEMGGSQLAGEMGAVSAEHLIAIGEGGLEALAQGGTIAMCLPGTSFYLDKPFAPAREMIRRNIPVALATDFNPGSCPSLNLQLIINLAYLKYKMMPEEILTGVTINPACAIGQGQEVGTLEVGKKGDLVIWDAPDMETLCYRFGSNLAIQTIKEGEIVV